MLKDFLHENWEELISTKVPSSLQVVPISSCLYDYGNDVVLLFVNNNTFPDYVMKISRNPTYSFKLKNEFAALKSLNSVEKLSAYIPYPYYIGDFRQNTFFIQNGVPGTNLFKMIKQEGINKSTYSLLNKAIEILLLINSTRNYGESKELYCSEKFPDILQKYENDLINHGLERVMIEELKEHCGYFYGKDESFFLHGDYWQTNIIIKNNNIRGIIDWEFSMPNSNIPTDIIWFLINLGHCMHLNSDPATNIPESFKWTFFTKGEHNEVISSCYKNYIDGIGWDRNLFENLLKVTLVKMSLRELIAYGEHTNMDMVCMEMLKYLFQNDKNIYIT